jgi:hypothetical protein
MMSDSKLVTRGIRLPADAFERLALAAKRNNTSIARIVLCCAMFDDALIDKLIGRYLPIAGERYPHGQSGRKPLSEADRAFLALTEAQKREILEKTPK